MGRDGTNDESTDQRSDLSTQRNVQPAPSEIGTDHARAKEVETEPIRGRRAGGHMSLTVRDGLAWLCDPEAAPPKQRNLAQLAAKMRPLAKRLGELRAERPMDVVWSLCGAETTAASRRKRGQLPMEATGFIVLARLEAATRQHDNAAKQAEKEGTS